MSFEVPNLTLLRHFVVVAQERGISRAAKRLRISQPALSKNIRRLEELVGTQLFDRHSGGSELTVTGQAFLDHAQVIGLEYQHALQKIRNLLSEQESTITIGTGPVWTSTVIPAAVPRFHERFPRHRLMVQTGHADRMIEDLRLGRIDIFAGALIRQNEMPGFRRLKIARAQLGVMCSENHPLAPGSPHS
jgi:DNA-binding transcriptional LysR family regulator